MKKVFLCAAAVAMLGLAACSNKNAENADTAALDSLQDTTVVVETEVAVDSINPDSAAVAVTEAAAEVVTPAEAPAN